MPFEIGAFSKGVLYDHRGADLFFFFALEKAPSENEGKKVWWDIPTGPVLLTCVRIQCTERTRKWMGKDGRSLENFLISFSEEVAVW